MKRKQVGVPPVNDSESKIKVQVEMENDGVEEKVEKAVEKHLQKSGIGISNKKIINGRAGL